MAVQRRHRHPDRWCDLAGGHARCQELSRGLDPLGRHDLLAPTYPACATRDDERGRRSLAHEVAFHLGHRSHDVKDELPRRPCRVDAIGDGSKADAAICQLGRKIDQPLHRPAKAIELPYDRSEEHTSELQSLMRISYAVLCLKTKIIQQTKLNL